MKKKVTLLVILGFLVSILCLSSTHAATAMSENQLSQIYGGYCQNDCESQTTGCPIQTGCGPGIPDGHDCTVCEDTTKNEACGPKYESWGIMCSSDDPHTCATSGYNGGCYSIDCLKDGTTPLKTPCPGGDVAQCNW